MKIFLDKRFQKQVKGVFEKYEFQVGMKDAPHYAAQKGEKGLKGQDVLTTYAGGPARKFDKTKPDGSLSDVAEKFRKYLGFNFWTRPFEKKTAEINLFIEDFFKYSFGKSEKQRLKNTIQAIVRNPILRGDYGHNSKVTQAIKTFDRLGIDTAQFFKGIVSDIKERARL